MHKINIQVILSVFIILIVNTIVDAQLPYIISEKENTLAGVNCAEINCYVIYNTPRTVYVGQERTSVPIRSSMAFRNAACKDVMLYSVHDPGSITYLFTKGKLLSGYSFLNLGLTERTGKFNVRLYYEEYSGFVGIGCRPTSYKQVGQMDFCRLKKNNTMYGLVGPTGGDAGESVSAIADASGDAVIRLTWVGNEANYCHETLSRAAGGRVLVVRMADSDPGTSIVKEDGTPISWEAGTGESSKRYYPPVKLKGIGRHVVSMRVKDQFGNEFYTPPITVTVLPSCYAAPDPVVTLSGPGIQTIGGGYNDPLGSYRLQQDKEYTLNLNYIEDFCSHYQVSLGDGYTVVPPSMDGPCLPPVHSGAPLSSGLEITGHLSHNRGFRFIPRDQVSGYKIDVQKRPSLSAAESNPVLGYMCPDYKPIVITVGGENENYSSNCLIVLAPSTVPVLFPGVSSYTTINSILQYFDYSLYSSQGIIVRSEGGDGVFLKDGALLQIIGRTGEGELPLVEQADNNKNWVQTRAYDDDGRVIAETKQFFDNRARSVQVQTKNLTAGVVMATQTLYDKYGRVAIETLPAPVRASEKTEMMDDCGDDIQQGQNMYFVFKEDFMTSANGQYRYTDFDDVGINERKNNPVGLSDMQPGTLGWYYGHHNTESAVVDRSKNEQYLIEPLVATTAFPYSRVLYLEDGTNEIVASTMPGDMHRAGLEKYSQVLTGALSDEDKVLINDYLRIKKRHVFPGIEVPDDMNNTAYRVLKKDMDQNEVVAILDEEGRKIIAYQVATEKKSFSYYDIYGRLVCSITPKGVIELLLDIDNSSVYNTIDKTTYRYNYKGNMVERNEKDYGTTKYMYRSDGAIRYSQNDEQKRSNSFIYILYDYAGRAIESGVFTPDSGSDLMFNSAALKQTLEEGADNEDLNIGGTKSEVLGVVFDLPDEQLNVNEYIGEQSFVRGRVSCSYRKENDEVLKTWYSYDERGRIVWTAQRIPGLSYDQLEYSIKKMTYTYDPKGCVKEVAYTGTMMNDNLYHTFFYDLDGRLSNVYTSVTKPVYDQKGRLINGKLQAKYEYYLHGPLKRVELAENLQGIDYVYTPQGWLKAINSPNTEFDPGADGRADSDFPEDVFASRYDYYDNDYVKHGSGIMSEKYYKGSLAYKQHYNGMLSGMVWMTKDESGNKKPGAYAFDYGQSNQLINADFLSSNVSSGANYDPVFVTGRFQERDITYDLNGNIKTLARTKGDATLLHNFQYQYTDRSNRLEQVQNLIDNSIYASYTYDAIGQVRSITQNGKTTYVHFDNRGMLTAMSHDESGMEPIVKFYYDEKGLCYKKESFHSELYSLLSTTYYVTDMSKNTVAVYDDNNGSNVLRKIEAPVYGADRLGMLSYQEHSTQYLYELKDHLGSTRAVVFPIYETQPMLNYTTSFEGTDLEAFGADYTGFTRIVPEEIRQPGYGTQCVSLRFPVRSKSVSYRKQVKPGDIVSNVSVKAHYSQDGIRAGRLVMGLFSSTGEQLFYDPERLYPAIDSSIYGGVKMVWNTLSLNTLIVPAMLHDARGRIVNPDEVNVEIFVRQGAESGDAEILYDQLQVRISYSAKIEKGTLQGLVAYTNYYPYGQPMDDRYVSGSEYRYGYQGQYAEQDPESGFNRFELRMYDSKIGRWLGPDLYRQYYSAYIGMGNNPISMVDPDGGYSWFGAFVRNGFSMNGIHKNKRTGEWGVRTGENIDAGTDIDGAVVITAEYNYGKSWRSPNHDTYMENWERFFPRGGKDADYKLIENDGSLGKGAILLMTGPLAVFASAGIITYSGAIVAMGVQHAPKIFLAGMYLNSIINEAARTSLIPGALYFVQEVARRFPDVDNELRSSNYETYWENLGHRVLRKNVIWGHRIHRENVIND